MSEIPLRDATKKLHTLPKFTTFLSTNRILGHHSAFFRICEDFCGLSKNITHQMSLGFNSFDFLSQDVVS